MKIPTVIHASAALALLTAGAAMGDVLRDVTTTNFAREGAWGTKIGNTCQQVINRNNWTAWVASENGEYRVVYEFRLDNLGITAANVTSATLKFDAASWLVGRNGVTVDQITSDLLVSGNEMYESPLGKVKSNGWTGGSYAIDITSIFKAALASASSTQGLALRFYNNNTADPIPWDGSTVSVNSGYNVNNVHIEVVPEPAALGLLALGSLVLLRRRR